MVSDCAWICLQAFSSILHAISGSASPGCRHHSGRLKTSVGWWSSPYTLPSLWGTLVSQIDLLKPYLRGGLGECISTSSTSSIFTKDRLGSVSRREGDGDSEWVGKLGGIGGVKGLGCPGIGGKSIGAGSSTPEGSGADDSISGVSLIEGVCSLEWDNGHLGKCSSSKIAWVEQNITFPCVWRINL